MKISELVKLLQEQQKMYGDEDVKVRDHSSGIRYNVDYVTYYFYSQCLINTKDKNRF